MPRIFESGRFLVIASQYAGDVAVLLAMRVKPENIFGVDVDRHAVDAAQYKYPHIRFEKCAFWEATQAFPELRKGIDCAFIDLCCPLRTAVVQKVIELADQTRYLRYVGFEFMYGREMGEVLEHMKLPKGKNHALVAPRLRYLQELKHNHQHFNVLKSWHYRSHSVAHVGKPMLATLGQITKTKSNVLESELVEADLHDVKEFTKKADRRLLNISEGTLAAWKAHDTRGTYR